MKLESLKETKFQKFEADKIMDLISITGGTQSACSGGCYDIFSWTARPNQPGFSDRDNVKWYKCTDVIDPKGIIITVPLPADSTNIC